MSRRTDAKQAVLDLLLKEPLTLRALARRSGLSPQAVSRAITDIRNDPALVTIRVPTRYDDYTYGVAFTVDALINGIHNQSRHLRTRGESMVTLGDKMTKIASTPEDYRLAAETRVRGEQVVENANALLKTVAEFRRTAA